MNILNNLYTNSGLKQFVGIASGKKYTTKVSFNNIIINLGIKQLIEKYIKSGKISIIR